MFKKVRLLTLVMCAVAMTMAISAVAFASVPDPYYLVSDATTTSSALDVKVVVESKQYSSTDSTVISGVYDVSLDPTNDTPANSSYYTVLDAMIKFNNTNGDGITARDAHDNVIDQNDSYILYMQLDTVENNQTVTRKYMPALPFDDTDYALDGWMFKVNDRIPLLTNASVATRNGATISDTPISDGDVIHFYWDYPYEDSLFSGELGSATYLTTDLGYSNGSLSIQLIKSKNWFDNDGWNIDPFSSFSVSGSGTDTYPVYVYNKAGQEVATGTIAKSTGAGSITCTLSSSGSPYYVKVPTTTYRSFMGYDEYFMNYLTWTIIDNTMAYGRITIS